MVLKEQGKMAEALAHLEQALRLEATDRRRVLLATLLPPVYRSLADLQAWRDRFCTGVADLQRRGVRLSLEDEPCLLPFYLVYQGYEDRDLQRALAQLYQAPPAPLEVRPYEGLRKIRIGLISAFWRNHTIGRLLRGFIPHLDRAAF